VAVGSCLFEYGPTSSYGSTVQCAALPGAGSQPVAVTAPVEGLSARATYHFRVVTRAEGLSYGGDETLLTLPQPPTVASTEYFGVTQQAAGVAATVDPHGVTLASCEVQYGPSEADIGQSAAACSASGQSSGVDQTVAGELTGLAPASTYYFRVLVSTIGGTTAGGVSALTTQLPVKLEGPSLGPSPSGGGSSPSGYTPPPPAPQLPSLLGADLMTRGGAVLIRLRCPPSAAACAGRLVLKTRSAIAAGGHRARRITIASGSFELARGQSLLLRLRLTREGRILLARERHVLAAEAALMPSAPSGAVKQVAVTLR
jgi:hypothetical protein